MIKNNKNYFTTSNKIENMVYFFQIVEESMKKSIFYCAVTGTAGKTSVCDLVLQLWTLLGLKGASIGTLGIRSEYVFEELSFLTTPSRDHLNEYRKQIEESDVENVILEASSHGLKQNRLGDLKVDVGVFTNFSHDHLDYHKTLEDYLESKQLLFSQHLKKDGIAVINADIPEFEIIKKNLSSFFSFGYLESATLCILSAKPAHNGQIVSFTYKNETYEVCVPLIGTTQLYNVLTAISVLLVQTISIDKILTVIPLVKPIPGRLECVGTYNKASVFVDYAHKPEALEKVLLDLKQNCTGKLYVVFGCGGDRDTQKRPMMGRIAETLADVVIITDDNPRTEDPTVIRKSILEKCPKGKEIEGRKVAIEYALSQLSENDILLIAGKGHEDYQIIGTTKYSFSDVEVVKDYIKCN